MAGINRALIRGYGRIIYENKVVQNNSKVCVFISHKSSDMDAAAQGISPHFKNIA